ncbi:hypothetical protein ACFLZG_01040 [Thermodesulfobacteriota bacterium]
MPTDPLDAGVFMAGFAGGEFLKLGEVFGATGVISFSPARRAPSARLPEIHHNVNVSMV